MNKRKKYPVQDQLRVIHGQKTFGPTFGSKAIYCSQNFLFEPCKSVEGNSYNASPHVLTGGNNFILKELEVYTVQIEE